MRDSFGWPEQNRKWVAVELRFDLVGRLTDLIDSQVIKQGGIVGKHAGDGASALFWSNNSGTPSRRRHQPRSERQG
jgi:hypothetical protein